MRRDGGRERERLLWWRALRGEAGAGLDEPIARRQTAGPAVSP